MLISRSKLPLRELGPNQVIGTSSLRRKAQIKAFKMKAKVEDIRGNVDTRIKKVKEGKIDAVILAAAGVLRLGLENEITEYFEPREFIPAPGQGAIGVECRAEDDELRLKLRRIHHDESGQSVSAERAFMRKLGANCALPLGAWCEIEQFQMRLYAFLSNAEGTEVMMDSGIAPIGHGERLGERLRSRSSGRPIPLARQSSSMD